MAFERREAVGGAVDTAITADITDVSLSIGITSSTGWPSGGANGPFFAIIDYDVAGKEKIEVASRTGTTLTIASTGKRGIDGTAASAHLAGAKIRHCHTSQDTNEANKTMAETIGRMTTKGDIVVATGAQATARLAVGTNNQVPIADSSQATGWRWGTLTSASLGTDSVGSTQIAADAVGASEIAADSVGTSEIAPLAVTSAELAADSVIAGKIAAGAISQSGDFAAGVVDSTALAAAAVTAGKIAAGGVSATNQIVDAIVTLAKFASEASTDWSSSISFDNVTLGTGGKYARYFKLGRLVVLFYGFQLGTGGDVTGKIGFNLPFTAADLTGGLGIGNGGGLVVGRAVFPGVWSGTGAILLADNKATDLIAAGGSVSDTWDANTPHDWQNGSTLQGIVVYVATA